MVEELRPCEKVMTSWPFFFSSYTSSPSNFYISLFHSFEKILLFVANQHPSINVCDWCVVLTRSFFFNKEIVRTKKRKQKEQHCVQNDSLITFFTLINFKTTTTTNIRRIEATSWLCDRVMSDEVMMFNSPNEILTQKTQSILFTTELVWQWRTKMDGRKWTHSKSMW